MKNLLLTIRGGIGRQDFWIGFAAIAVIVFAYNTALRMNETGGVVNFWLILIILPLILYMITCVYCKRLTDMGRTRWIFTGAIFFEFLVIIALMMMFGGEEYFDFYAQFDRNEDIDPVLVKEVNEAFQAKIQANMNVIGPAMLAIPVALTLWLAASPTRTKTA